MIANGAAFLSCVPTGEGHPPPDIPSVTSEGLFSGARQPRHAHAHARAHARDHARDHARAVSPQERLQRAERLLLSEAVRIRVERTDASFAGTQDGVGVGCPGQARRLSSGALL